MIVPTYHMIKLRWLQLQTQFTFSWLRIYCRYGTVLGIVQVFSLFSPNSIKRKQMEFNERIQLHGEKFGRLLPGTFGLKFSTSRGWRGLLPVRVSYGTIYSADEFAASVCWSSDFSERENNCRLLGAHTKAAFWNASRKVTYILHFPFKRLPNWP